MKYIMFFLSLFLLSGCAETSRLWQKPRYHENISHFLATKDGEKLIFIGEKYHYIFNGTDDLNKLLKWKHRELLKANFDSNFFVSRTNKITGKYKITCSCDNATEDQLQWLKKNEFIKIL